MNLIINYIYYIIIFLKRIIVNKLLLKLIYIKMNYNLKFNIFNNISFILFLIIIIN